ncbi:hypothetical protein HLH17_10870 [Acinetobacter sp. ANC 5380]|uniref:Uncharacterized protein n=1 Tax=Acinetobacter terrae TaxID=2731247 RepID=A0A7Y2RG59_9GAMM|nr:hypothetical protein [Acinetobacter terrae]NNH78160.1 hypothetical protein [Acinetobacter terrae]
MSSKNKEYIVEPQYRTNSLSHVYAPNSISIDKGTYEIIYDNIHFPEAYLRLVNQGGTAQEGNYSEEYLNFENDDFDIAEDYYGAPSGLSESEKEAWIEANEKDWD